MRDGNRSNARWCAVVAALPALLGNASTLFAAQFAVPAVERPNPGRYDPESGVYVSSATGKPAHLQAADTCVSYCQFQRPTGTPSNRDTEWYDAPDGFKQDN